MTKLLSSIGIFYLVLAAQVQAKAIGLDKRDVAIHISFDDNVKQAPASNSQPTLYSEGSKTLGAHGARERLPCQKYSAQTEFTQTLMFDEILTDDEFVYPDGYGGLQWSKNFYIYNSTEKEISAYNKPVSPPNQLYVQDSSFSGGDEPSFEVRPSSPELSFKLHSFAILPVQNPLNAPVSFSIRAWPAKGGEPLVRWYRWNYNYQLQNPWVAPVGGIEYVKKVEIYVVPGADQTTSERLPFTLDNIKITWQDIGNDRAWDSCVMDAPEHE
ncbi:hypothetical protein RUND412_007921 [Rhizina undulata]